MNTVSIRRTWIDQAKRTVKLPVLWLMRACGLFWLARVITTRRAFMVIGWHGVSIADEHTRFPNLFISPATLRRRLAYLRRHFKIIDLETAIQQHEDGTLQPRQAVLTFDDGYWNFAASAVPLLREFDLPATAFIVTAHMQSEAPLYHHLIEDLVLATRQAEVCLDCPGVTASFDLTAAAGRLALRDAARQHVRRLEESGGDVRGFLQRLAEALRVDLDSRISQRVWDTLSRDEVRALADEGFAMQPHSHTHRNLVDQPDELWSELSLSRSLLEAATGCAAEHFCYPSGRWNRACWKVLDMAGIRSAVTTRGGPNFAQTPRLALRRCMDGEFSTQLEFEYEVSGLHWLLHMIRHPGRIYAPSEKHRTYAEAPVAF